MPYFPQKRMKLKRKIEKFAILSSGLKLEMLFFSSGIIFWYFSYMSNPFKIFWFDFAVASFISFIINLIPLGKGDGSIIISQLTGIKDFRNKSVEFFRAWFFRKLFPESATEKEKRIYISYGLFADTYYMLLNIFVLWFAGYILTFSLKGTGFFIFLIILF